MNYTQNIQLPQWVESDRIRMDDFNEAMVKIDEGITEASRPPFRAGVLADYDGSAEVQVDLGCQPSLVMVGNRLGWSNIITTSSSTSDPGHAVALPGYPGYFSGTSDDGGSKVALEVTATGFILHAGMLQKLKPYYYIALFDSQE